jgi:hypothetical protein
MTTIKPRRALAEPPRARLAASRLEDSELRIAALALAIAAAGALALVVPLRRGMVR